MFSLALAQHATGSPIICLKCCSTSSTLVGLARLRVLGTKWQGWGSHCKCPVIFLLMNCWRDLPWVTTCYSKSLWKCSWSNVFFIAWNLRSLLNMQSSMVLPPNSRFQILSSCEDRCVHESINVTARLPLMMDPWLKH